MKLNNRGPRGVPPGSHNILVKSFVFSQHYFRETRSRPFPREPLVARFGRKRLVPIPSMDSRVWTLWPSIEPRDEPIRRTRVCPGRHWIGAAGHAPQLLILEPAILEPAILDPRSSNLVPRAGNPRTSIIDHRAGDQRPATSRAGDRSDRRRPRAAAAGPRTSNLEPRTIRCNQRPRGSVERIN